MNSEKNHFNKYLLLIFFTGAVVLSLELLASRILTPFFGVSLYIWTSILSITLIFLAIGYQFGGWLTSKIKSELSWKPSVSFEEGLSTTIDWYLNNQLWLKNVSSGDYKNYYLKQYKR